MRTRIDLDNAFREILGNGNVYFQPGENVEMRYPCIRYSVYDVMNAGADNLPYLQNPAYQVILIDPDPDNDHWKQLSSLPLCSMDRTYVSNNLYHYVFTIYI